MLWIEVVMTIIALIVLGWLVYEGLRDKGDGWF